MDRCSYFITNTFYGSKICRFEIKILNSCENKVVPNDHFQGLQLSPTVKLYPPIFVIFNVKHSALPRIFKFVPNFLFNLQSFMISCYTFLMFIVSGIFNVPNAKHLQKSFVRLNTGDKLNVPDAINLSNNLHQWQCQK